MNWDELKEELDKPLAECEINWLRRSMLPILFIPLLLIHIGTGMLNGLIQFIDITIDIWKGK